MENAISFIDQKQIFDELQRLLESVVCPDNRLPRQVFNKSFDHFVFEEFDWAMSPDFWETIKQLAILSNDSYVLTAVLEPSPIDYFYREFGCYNWMKIPVNISANEYWDLLQLEPQGSPADAILYNSEIITWVSSSIEWAIWGERSCGICILAFKKDSKLITSTSLNTWCTVNEALTKLLPINFEGKEVPKNFSDTLKSSYSNN